MSIPSSVMTFNICNFTPEFLQKAGSQEELGWPAKSSQVFAVIKSAMPTFVALQELRNHSDSPCMLGEFWQVLGKLGYEFVHWKYNFSFWNAIAFKTNEFALDCIEKWWSNPENPEKFGDPLKGWARVVLMAKFYPVLKNSKSLDPDYDKDPIYVLNGHPGLKHSERMDHHEISIKKIHEKVTKGHVFFCMDMNCFPDDGGAEEIALFRKTGFIDLTAILNSKYGFTVPGTYLARLGKTQPIDKFAPPKGQLGPHFDRIWYKAIAVPSIADQYHCSVDLGKYNGKPEPEALKSIEPLFVSPSGEDLRNEFPSDHLPVIVKLTETSRSEESKEAKKKRDSKQGTLNLFS